MFRPASSAFYILHLKQPDKNKSSVLRDKKLRKKTQKAVLMPLLDQYQYLGNCPPTPPLTQQQSIDNKLGLMLG